VFTAGRAGSVGRASPTLHKKIVRSRTLLRILQRGAEALVEGRVLDAASLPRVEGRGPLATAQACVSFASLFRGNHGKTRGVTAVKPALVREAAELGSELLREVKPRGVGTRGARTEAERLAADDRDRMAVVAVRLYDYVERVAAWRWGRSCEAVVPLMASRALPRGEGAAAEELDDATDEDEADDGEADEEGAIDADGGADEEPDAPAAAKDEPADDDAEDAPAVSATSKPKKPAAKKPAAKKPAPAKRATR